MTSMSTCRIDAAPEMQLSILRSSAHTIIKLRGELDVATAPKARERLFAALVPGTKLLVLDLSSMWFCDAAGAAVLIGTQRRATTLDITIRLAAPRPTVANTLRITGLDRRLTIHSTLSDALTPPARTPGESRRRDIPA
jgi:anti-sigma B factor antagonist